MLTLNRSLNKNKMIVIEVYGYPIYNSTDCEVN